MRKLALIGAPSSAGAYAPGQEKTPRALREAGLLDRLTEQGFDCIDLGDVPGFRWRADAANPYAMNAGEVARVVRAVAGKVAEARAGGRIALVIGGDCTVELGTVAGILHGEPDAGLIYFDLDADLNTPDTTTDGALDWMGVAHLLDVAGTIDALAALGPRRPMLAPDAVHLLGTRNIEPAEQARIDSLGVAVTRAEAVAANPAGAAQQAAVWGAARAALLVHLDVDAIDFEDFPLAENVRRKFGLRYTDAMAALGELMRAPNLAALTVCEINPDHGYADGSTLRSFAAGLAAAMAGMPIRV
jgi:arginase